MAQYLHADDRVFLLFSKMELIVRFLDTIPSYALPALESERHPHSHLRLGLLSHE